MLRKAWDLVGPVRSATRPVRETLSEPFRGELDEEQTLENIMGKEFPDPEDWIAVRREAPRKQIVLMMDTSLSTSGRNLALAAVAAAVLAFKVKAEDLDVGRAELARGDNPQKVGLLITDGVFTAGKDPVARAALFPKLYVLLTEDYVMDAELCQKMARAGRGEIFRVCGYQDLPRRMLEVANRILR